MGFLLQTELLKTKVLTMNLDQTQLRNDLKKHFNLAQFRIGQSEIISAVLSNKDVLAVLPTGGGKSLCYQLPAIFTQKLVIVISPLIALMKDQVMSLHRQNIPAGCLHSGQTDMEKRQVFANINKGGAFVLYLSPERAQKEGFQKWILDRPIALFAIDEAHCVSQWGHDFREEYAQLKVLKALRPDVPILALTASATPTVLSDIARNLKMNKPEKMVHGFYRSNLYYQVETCQDDADKLSTMLEAVRKVKEGRVIIYCGTRKVTEELAELLKKRFSGVGHYHAGLSSQERSNTQQEYAEGILRILVATNAFGMGIDQPDVRLVVHYQMPANIDALYQEMGRAGRDGIDSTCLMLYAKKDKGLQSYFIQNSDAPELIKDARWRNLDALVNYSEGSECRHAEILTYYKDSQRIQNCGHCDNCLPNSDRRILKPIVIAPELELKVKVRKKKNKEEAFIMSHEQELLFQTLKKWRKAKAQELDMPAFVVLSDQTLKHLAVGQPSNTDQLLLIHGIGENKAEKFGKDILSIVEQMHF